MAEKLLILGESGQGKSTSLLHCDPKTTCVVSPAGKRLPFKNNIDMLKGETKCGDIMDWIEEEVNKGKKLIVVDDFQYLLSVPYMNRIHENGWDKYNDFADDYFKIIKMANVLPDDVLMVFMSHTEQLDDGVTRIKLIGKLLREKITIEGLFETVLACKKIDEGYYFLTQSNGKDTIKSPIGMFDSYAIDNNLAYVYEKVKNYYEFGEYESDEEIAKATEEVSHTEIQKPVKRTKKREQTTEEPKRTPRKSRMEQKVEEGIGNQNEDDKFSEEFLAEQMPVEESVHAKNLAKAIEEQKAARKAERDRQEAEAIDSKIDQLEEQVKQPKKRTRKVRK